MPTGTVLLLDARNGSILVALDGHRDEVEPAEFTPDGGALVSSSTDGTARVWTAPHRQPEDQ